jgi:hypothetical protein
MLAAEVRPAEVAPNGDNRIDVAERRVVTVAVATATDAVQRSILGSGDGVGLRAGTFHTDYGSDAWTTTLTGCSFSKDVIVDGTVIWGVAKSFVADLIVGGSGTAGGTLHVEGTWQALGRSENSRSRVASVAATWRCSCRKDERSSAPPPSQHHSSRHVEARSSIRRR